MTDPISNLASSTALDKATLEKSKRRTDSALGNDSAARSAPSALKDEVVLSNIAKRAQEEPAFDRAKVESIKQAIKDGNYPMNSRRIAESFVAIEKMIGE